MSKGKGAASKGLPPAKDGKGKGVIIIFRIYFILLTLWASEEEGQSRTEGTGKLILL